MSRIGMLANSVAYRLTEPHVDTSDSIEIGRELVELIRAVVREELSATRAAALDTGSQVPQGGEAT